MLEKIASFHGCAGAGRAELVDEQVDDVAAHAEVNAPTYHRSP
jgi:hypothetical protein